MPPFQHDNLGSRNYFGRYYTSIQEKENEFEAILDLVDKHNLKNKTIVFYADDHGMARGKFTVYKSGLNVAFMVRWPGCIQPGRSDALVSFADFVPTVLDLAHENASPKVLTLTAKACFLFLKVLRLANTNIYMEWGTVRESKIVTFFHKGRFMMDDIIISIILMRVSD